MTDTEILKDMIKDYEELRMTDFEKTILFDQLQYLSKQLMQEGVERGWKLEEFELQGSVKLYEEVEYNEQFSIVPYVILNVVHDYTGGTFVNVLALKKKK